MKKSGSTKKQPRQFQQPEQHRINAKIKAKEVRIIGENGEQIGIKTIQEALTLAQEANLDLVEVAPNASPPVCKLIDYGKFKYRLQKKKAEAKKNRTGSFSEMRAQSSQFNQNSIDAWRDRLHPAVAKAISLFAGRELRRFGYL